MQNIKDYIKEHSGARWSDLLRREWPSASGQGKVKYGKTALARYLHTLELNGKIEKKGWKAILHRGLRLSS